MSSTTTSTTTQLQNTEQFALARIRSAIADDGSSTFGAGRVHGLIEAFLTCGIITNEQAHELTDQTAAQPQSAADNAPQPAALTAAKPFFKLSSGQNRLFQVMPGLSALDALEQASAFLAMSDSRLSEHISEASRIDSDNGLVALHFVEMAKGIIDSVTSGMMKRSAK